MYCFMKLLRFATPLLGLCLFLNALPAAGQTDAEIRGLINRLDTQGPAALDARRRATETLEGFIRNNRLTPAQFEILRTYPPGPALELLRRKELILSRWTTQFPTVAMAIDRTRFETLPRSIARSWYFKIDGFFGGANIGDATVVGYYQRYEDARNALAAADTTQALARLTDLRNYVLDPLNFDQFNLATDPDLRNPVTRLQVAAGFDQAIIATQKAIQDINVGSNNVMPPARQPVPVQGQGAIDVGRTLRLALSNNPLAAGGLDILPHARQGVRKFAAERGSASRLTF